MSHEVFTGDCLEILRGFEDNRFDSVVTDPPSGIGFMGNDWDKDRGGRDKWVAWLSSRLRECYRVAKPGAHMLVWALPRTSHWTALAIEEAGWEIRDRISHLFGTGFPKTANISKMIDRSLGFEPIPVGVNPNHRAESGTAYTGIYSGQNTGSPMLTEPASEQAKSWADWGTGLKPGGEDWWLARKPFDGPVYKNVLKYGTGALNIGSCRITTDDKLTRKLGKSTESSSGWKSINRSEVAGKDGGRWPANVVIDESSIEELRRMSDSAPKFYYTPKASRSEKDSAGKNTHPTVKSVDLMRWLCRLITPANGVVLDPFAGSGSTGVACVAEGFSFCGIEMSPEWSELARLRINHADANLLD